MLFELKDALQAKVLLLKKEESTNASANYARSCEKMLGM